MQPEPCRKSLHLIRANAGPLTLEETLVTSIAIATMRPDTLTLEETLVASIAVANYRKQETLDKGERMPIIVTAEKQYTPHPVGLYQAVCCDVVDLGDLEVTYNGKTKKQHKIKIVWQSEETRDDGKRYLLSRRYTCSLHEKASLAKDLQSWRGKAFTSEELRGFDIESLIGVNCSVNLIHNEREGKTYANVASISPLMRGVPKIGVTDYVREQDREADHPADEGSGGNGNAMITDDDVPF